MALITDSSGAVASYGKANVNAVRMAVDELNAKGGVDGRKVELLVRDSKATPETGVQLARDAVLRSKVSAIFGPVSSGVAVAMTDVAKQFKTPIFFHTSNTRENRLRAAFLGIDVKRYELAAFTLAGAFDSLAGSLFALFNREAYPNLLFWTANALPIFIILIGGIRWLVAGPLVGAVAFVLLEEQVTRETGYPDLVFGAILLAIVLVAPGGLIGLVTSAWRRARWRAGEVAAPPPPVAPRDGGGDVGMNALLVTQGVAKSFNGFHAVDGVDLRVAEGERRAVIGPKGAGKTTLFSLLTGQLRPDAGTVRLAGRDITGLPRNGSPPRGSRERSRSRASSAR